MYTPLSREIMEPIAQTLVDAILEQTRGAPHKEENLVAGEADHNILTDVVLRELRNYMSDAFMTAYLFDNSEYHRVRQREGEERERVRKEEAMAAIQIGLEPREAEVRTPCGEVLPEDFIECMCDVCNDAYMDGRKIHLALS